MSVSISSFQWVTSSSALITIAGSGNAATVVSNISRQNSPSIRSRVVRSLSAGMSGWIVCVLMGFLAERAGPERPGYDPSVLPLASQ